MHCTFRISKLNLFVSEEWPKYHCLNFVNFKGLFPHRAAEVKEKCLGKGEILKIFPPLGKFRRVTYINYLTELKI